jgi:hypothetical protein
MDKTLPESTSVVSKLRSSKNVYLLLIPVFLILIFAALVIYFYGYKKINTLVETDKEASVISVRQINSLKENDRIIREEVVSMAGRVVEVGEMGIRINRKDQEIFVPVNDSAQVFLLEIPAEKAIIVDDNGYGAIGEPIQLNADTKITFGDILKDDQMLIFFNKDDRDNLSAKFVYVFRSK